MAEHGQGGTRCQVGTAMIACVSFLLVGCSSTSSSSSAGDVTSATTGVSTSRPSAAGVTTSATPPVTGAGATKVDPCTIMTAEDVHTVLGGTVSVKRDDTDGVGRGCDFNVAGSLLGNYASVDVLTDVALPPEGESVTGVGDSAIYDPLEGIPFITFIKHGASVEISYGSDTQVAASKQLATIKFPANIKALTIALATTVARRL